MLLTIADLKGAKAGAYTEVAARLGYEYEDFLENYLEEDLRTPGVHASELNCARRMTYNLLKVPKDLHISAFWRKRFQIGHAIHDMVQSNLEKMMSERSGKATFEREVRISPDCNELAREKCIYSSCDGLFTFYERKDDCSPWYPTLRIILEIKSSSDAEMAKLKGPKPEHIEQATLYMKALDVPLCWFLYYNKTSQNHTPSTKPWLYTFDPRVWTAVEANINIALHGAETLELPDRAEGSHCMFCPWSKICGPKSVRAWQPAPTKMRVRSR